MARRQSQSHSQAQSDQGPESARWFERAQAVLAGGVNSPSRSYAAVGDAWPVYMERGEGAYLYDVGGHRYIDYLAAFGALILGHGERRVAEAVASQITRGALYGTCHPLEVQLAEELRRAMPRLELLRFTASGTEAVMSAIRVARGFTGRTKIVKFDGSYHGHSDPVLVSAGSGTSTFGLGDSAGLPASIHQEVISLPYNDIGTVQATLAQHGPEVAAVLFEPIVGNFGIVPPEPGFLAAVQQAARQAGALLIDDEVITGFRFRYGGVYDQLGIDPDLITVGKIIGGGLAIGAYGGRRQIMAKVTPLGPVYQDGTWAGNPLAMAAGLACLEVLRTPGLYERLDQFGQQLEQGLRQSAQRHGVPVQINRVGGAFTLFFHDQPIRRFTDTQAASSSRYALFFNQLLQRGILLPPSKFEAWFVNAAHTQADIDQTLAAADEALAAVAAAGLDENQDKAEG